MGTHLSVLSENVLGRGTKRKSSDSHNALKEIMPARKRKKLMTTSQYIYKTLFEEGMNSDVTIVALGTEWKLHRIYLCQSRYFSSMFSGSWKEVDQPLVQVGIEDPNITIDALQTVFGSLYQDEINVDPSDVISIMAAATLFQLDGLIEQCGEIMIETINIKTILKYNEVGHEYGIINLKRKTFDWLLRNLTVNVNDSLNCLREISVVTMFELIGSSELVVVQTEFSIYILLKIWVFLKENPIWDGESKEALLEAHNYFQEQSKEKSEYFLESLKGEKYFPVFKKVRIQHLVMHHLDVEQLETDKIIPNSWFQPIFRDHWFRMLRVNQGVDKGPKQVSEQDFDNQCVRCGRVLLTDSQHIWLWTGYQFGQDLIISCVGRCLSLRRSQRGNSDVHSSSSSSGNLQTKRHLMYRFVVYSLNVDGQTNYTNSSALQSITLSKNEEVKVLTIDKEAKFPILINANFLMTTPLYSAEPQLPS